MPEPLRFRITLRTTTKSIKLISFNYHQHFIINHAVVGIQCHSPALLCTYSRSGLRCRVTPGRRFPSSSKNKSNRHLIGHQLSITSLTWIAEIVPLQRKKFISSHTKANDFWKDRPYSEWNTSSHDHNLSPSCNHHSGPMRTEMSRTR